MEPPPAPSTLQAPPTITPTNKAPRILACVLCQHRKIKCDRHFPCANCTKVRFAPLYVRGLANRIKANVKCTPSTPAPARKRRRPNQDLQERLARCEELLKEYATEKPEESAARAAKPEQVRLYDEPKPKWQPAGKLVEEDGGVRFMDNFLLGTVYDEVGPSSRWVVVIASLLTSWIAASHATDR